MIKATHTFINSSLARAAVGAVTILGEMREANATPSTFESDQDATSLETSAEDTEVQAATGFTNRVVVEMPSPISEYGRKEEKRFDELVILRATGKATNDQQKEFHELQVARRSAVQDNSPGAILAEFRRRQVLIDALKFLNRHVKFLQPEDQKRVRAIL